MKENNRNPGQFERSGPSSQLQLRGKGHRHEPACPTPLRVIGGVLALLLLVISGMSSLAVVKNSYAVSRCGVLLPCQSPKPSPSPSPSPSPTETATPGPSPTKTATPGPSPTKTATPSPDSTSYPASGFVANHWSIAECNDQRIAYGDLDSHLHRGHANAWRQPDERSCYNEKECRESDTKPIRRGWIFTSSGDCRNRFPGSAPLPGHWHVCLPPYAFATDQCEAAAERRSPVVTHSRAQSR